MGQVVGAGTAYHLLAHPTDRHLGIIKVGRADLDALAAAATRTADRLKDGFPEGWRRTAGSGSSSCGSRCTVARRAPSARTTPRRPRRPARPGALGGGEAELARRLAAARADITPLLLRGLLDARVTLGLSRLRGLFWTRPLSEDEIAEARARIAAHDEEAALLNAAVKPSDGFFTTFLVSPYSKYLARWAAHRRVTPNAVTCLSMAVGVVAALAFAAGSRPGMVAGALLLQASFTLDCVDGQLARYTRTFTALESARLDLRPGERGGRVRRAGGRRGCRGRGRLVVGRRHLGLADGAAHHGSRLQRRAVGDDRGAAASAPWRPSCR